MVGAVLAGDLGPSASSKRRPRSSSTPAGEVFRRATFALLKLSFSSEACRDIHSAAAYIIAESRPRKGLGFGPGSAFDGWITLKGKPPEKGKGQAGQPKTEREQNPGDDRKAEAGLSQADKREPIKEEKPQVEEHGDEDIEVVFHRLLGADPVQQRPGQVH